MANAYICDMDFLTNNDSGTTSDPRRVLVAHTFEGRDLDAAAMARYQQQPSAGGSYHLVIDKDGTTARENDDEFMPWAAFPTGNRIGYHFSLAGRAAFTRDQWINRPAQLTKLAEVLAAYSMAYGIPLIRRNAEGVRAGQWGVCGHAEISGAFHESDHTDPGVNFPYDHVLNLANGIVNDLKKGDTKVTNPLDEMITVWDKTRHKVRELIANIDSRTHIMFTETLPRIEQKLDQVLTEREKN
ncbi:hypothetical protein HMPREF2998_07950 [Corynebacterium sp. HMSC065A05]|uniref:peptidoglycan recognition protein family protein n=1 Tax=Corynebacterium sp. HMSC065A05 TaxID=1739502 RepID=UPI0008A17267|nr:peptidoglycan recognition family protein [Corynebacterium sp. HMSC065A05]OFP20313.1 hypothetical protein HMPREF2998_07950 [Corynebacterium sp. HMSC065A05]